MQVCIYIVIMVAVVKLSNILVHTGQYSIPILLVCLDLLSQIGRLPLLVISYLVVTYMTFFLVVQLKKM